LKRLELVVNGEIAASVDVAEDRRFAEITLDYPVDSSAWVAARCTGESHAELFYTHPVFAHTNPVYIQYGHSRVEKAASARYLLGFLRKLEGWVQNQAHFLDTSQRTRALETIQRGVDYFEDIIHRA
jgi:hypothetical protein